MVLAVLASLIIQYRYLLLKKRWQEVSGLFLQSEIDKDLLKKQMLQTIEDKKLVESEEFMAFLSKSREAAFSYIEEAQEGILKFNDAVYKANVDSQDPNQVLKRILDANKQLQKLLPDNIKKDNVQGEL